MSAPSVNLEPILKIGNLFLTAFAGVCGIVKWFEPKFTIGGLMNGFLILAVCAVIFLIELSQVNVAQYLGFLRFAWGKGVLFLLLGALFAEGWGLWIACWVIFWFWGIVIIVLAFVKPSGATPVSSTPAPDGYATPDAGGLANEGYDSYILK
jgi:hypothetical protein